MNRLDPDKYSGLSALKPSKPEAQPAESIAKDLREQPTASSSPTRKPLTEVRPPGSIMPSNEHHASIIELMTYTVNLESDAFVRIYDGVSAIREGALLVDRKELLGKSPEEIQSHFSLTFVPRLLCDARIPIGDKMSMGKLTNAAGRRISVFRGITAIHLSSERPITPDNIAPVPLNPPISKPMTSIQTQLSKRESADQQSDEETAAVQYLQQFRSPERDVHPIPDGMKGVGPDAFPYLFLKIDSYEAGPSSSAKPEASNVGDLWQSALNEGFGIALFKGDNAKPIFVFKYRDLLCLRLFDELRPSEYFDEQAYPDLSSKACPGSTGVTCHRASEQILPNYARLALEYKLFKILGFATLLDPQVIEMPEIDRLKRIKLNVSTKNLTDIQRKVIADWAWWFLPYAILF